MHMPTLLQLIPLTVIALSGSGLANPLNVRDSASCDSPISVSSSTATVNGNNTVTLEVLACTVQLEADGLLGILCPILGLFCPPNKHPKTTTVVKTTTVASATTTTDTETLTATTTVTATPSPTPSAIDVCGEICNTSCSEQGQLPPTTDDCQVVIEAIQIFEGNAAPTFIVQPSHIQQLTFGTCRFFFENLGTVPLEACWQDLANTGSFAATTCFPPASPFSTLAQCIAPDNTWEIGVSHS